MNPEFATRFSSDNGTHSASVNGADRTLRELLLALVAAQNGRRVRRYESNFDALFEDLCAPHDSPAMSFKTLRELDDHTLLRTLLPSMTDAQIESALSGAGAVADHRHS